MRKIIITESQLKSLISNNGSSLLGEEEVTDIKVVSVSFSFRAAYPVNSSDPTPFLADFTKTLIEKINAHKNGPEMLKSGEMTLNSGTFTAGASNTWLGKITPYDRENNYKVATEQNLEDPLYKKNVELATKRAQTFRPALFNFLKQNNISDSDSAKVTFKTIVLNTGGVKDEVRDTSKYPNPGQFMTVSLVFRYKKDIGRTVITTTEQISTYTQIKPNMVLTGSYYCNGKNSEGTVAGNAEMKDAMAESCKGVGGVKPENGKYSMAFEIKWDTNVLKDPYTAPILRWIFNYDGNGKINKVTRYVYNKNYIFLRNDVPQKTVSVTDKEMKYYMGIRSNEPETGGPFYAKFIQPYI
jgi:hypothetical protein